MTNTTKWWNFFERVGWTLAQALTGEGLLSSWELFRGELDSATHGIVLIVLITVVAAIKNALAVTFLNPTGSTLPTDKAPVAIEDVPTNVFSPPVILDPGTGTQFPNS